MTGTDSTCRPTASEICLADAMVTPRRKYRRPAMVTPKLYPYP